MSVQTLTCPRCGEQIETWLNPVPTVDVIIETGEGILLIQRKNPPYGWALPGGFVDYGETLETAARREALEETGMTVTSLRLLGCYSDPARDPRRHTISTVYIAEATGAPVAGDDAAEIAFFPPDRLPELCFDHATILADYLRATKPQNES